jgi:hypothetical protein
MQEPRDGDFVAYIEALQRESAERLAQHHINVNLAAAAPTGASKSASHFFESAAQAKPAPGAVVDEAVKRVLRPDVDAGLVKALVAGVFGLVFLLAWFGRGGALSFLIGVILLVYAVPRLLAAFRVLAVRTSNKAAVDQVFGRSGTKR